jgi:hypothetical protein
MREKKRQAVTARVEAHVGGKRDVSGIASDASLGFVPPAQTVTIVLINQHSAFSYRAHHANECIARAEQNTSFVLPSSLLSLRNLSSSDDIHRTLRQLSLMT